MQNVLLSNRSRKYPPFYEIQTKTKQRNIYTLLNIYTIGETL